MYKFVDGSAFLALSIIDKIFFIEVGFSKKVISTDTFFHQMKYLQCNILLYLHATYFSILQG